MNPRLPGYYSPPEAPAQSTRGRLSATQIKSYVPPARDRTLTVAAENTPIPIVYGEISVPGIVFARGTLSGDLVLGVSWGYGEFEAIDDIYINDTALPIAGVTVTNYLGTTSQTADATLASAIAAYADDMVVVEPQGSVGIAYSVFRIDPGALDASPRFQAAVRGRKVYDPGTDSVVYSDNSALCFGDLATNPVFGMGVDITGLADAEAWCDELLGGAVARCKLAIALTRPQRTEAYLDLLATYAELIWYWEGADIVVTPDRALQFDTVGDAKGNDVLDYSTESTAETYASGDYFAEDYAADTATIYSNWTLGSGWVFRPGVNPTATSASSSLTQVVSGSGETKYVAKFTIDSRTAGSVALHLNGVEVIAAKTAVGSYSAIVTGDFTGPDTFELVGSTFSGVLSGLELQQFVLTETNCVKDTLTVEGVDDGDTPSRVYVRYTNPSATSGYWSDALAFQSLPGVSEGEAALVESTLSLPGVTRSEEANNKALARLEQMKNRVRVSWVTTDKGIVHRKGDVVRHQMTTRGTDIYVRIQSVQMISYGRYRVTGMRYDPAHYPSELVLPEGTGTIPVGAILPLSGSTVPDGWAAFTDADGKYIVGAGNTYSGGDTGGDSTSIAANSTVTTTNSMHNVSTGSALLIHGTPGTGTFGNGSITEPGTDHNHTVSTPAFTIDPIRRENRLIKKTGAAGTTVPSQAQIFGLPNISVSGLSRVVASANMVLVAAAANADQGSTFQSLGSITSGSGGVSHDHADDTGLEPDLDFGPFPDRYLYGNSGSHTHPVNVYAVARIKAKTIALWGSGDEYPIVPGMIVLWENLASLPTDWVVCDGTGATPDLRDYFIKIAPIGGENVASGDNTLRIYGSANTVYHGHMFNRDQATRTTRYMQHGSNGGHNHSLVELTPSWTPPYYALGAIMYSPS